MFAVDDDFPTSPKLESIEDWRTQALAVACWTLLGAACRKRGNGGAVSRALLDGVLHRWPKKERLRAAEALVAATGDSDQGLWVANDRGWQFHDWEVWQPSADEAAKERKAREAKAERQRRWRHGKRLGVDGEASTRASTRASTAASTGDASKASTLPSTETPSTGVLPASLARRDAHACAAHDPVPSRPDPAPSGSNSSSSPPPSYASGKAGQEEDDPEFEGDEDRNVRGERAARWGLWSREYDKRYCRANDEWPAKGPKYAQHIKVLVSWSIDNELTDEQCCDVLDRFFEDRDKERVGDRHWVGYLVSKPGDYLDGRGAGAPIPLNRRVLA